tara:strand:+ start:261 stop:1049 length:789 start_codon:yes stop_codon:yes gene_type:complete
MDEIEKLFSNLKINENEILIIQRFFRNVLKNKKATKIQKIFRGYIIRLKQLPLILHIIQKYLKETTVKFANNNEDGRINSCFDENEVINLITKKFEKRIKKGKTRMWYDILLFDYLYGWIPVNIKSTETLTSDNTGNLAMCVYAYTDEVLDLNVSYENGKMSKLLCKKLNEKSYNYNYKKDYYFVVLNKKDNSDIIINSVKGLSILTPNINNLPYQVCWYKNRIYKYQNIKNVVKMFIKVLQKPKPSWKETFMINIRLIQLD